MQYAVGGVALGGWQLIDLFLMGAIGFALLGLIFLKVVIVLLGALLYAIGPLMIALVPTDGGIVIARAWASAALALLMVPLAWSTILAVGALLINDSSTAGPLIAGPGIDRQPPRWPAARPRRTRVTVAVHPRAREAGAVLRGQLGGLLVLGRARVSGATASAAPAPTRRASESLRSFAGGSPARPGPRSARRAARTGRRIRSPRSRGPQPPWTARRRRGRDPHRRTRGRAGTATWLAAAAQAQRPCEWLAPAPQAGRPRGPGPNARRR